MVTVTLLPGALPLPLWQPAPAGSQTSDNLHGQRHTIGQPPQPATLSILFLHLISTPLAQTPAKAQKKDGFTG